MFLHVQMLPAVLFRALETGQNIIFWFLRTRMTSQYFPTLRCCLSNIIQPSQEPHHRINFLACSSTSSLDMELVTSTANTFSSSSPTGSMSLDNFYKRMTILSRRETPWCLLTSIQSAELVSPACLWRIRCLRSLSDMVRQRMTRSGPSTDLR